MKTPSKYILVAEIIAIALFHAVKLRQADKHSPEAVFTQAKTVNPSQKPASENKSGVEYMLLKMIK